MQDIFTEIYEVIQKNKKKDPAESYVAKLFNKGQKKIARKVGEEAVETVIACLAENKKEVIAESADLLFHLLVLWAYEDIKPQEIVAELKSRRKKEV